MKSLLIFFGFCILFCSCKSWEDTLTENRILRKESKEIENLLTNTIEIHRLLLEQGKLIKDRGTTSPIQEYGDLIVKSETELIFKIERISQKENLNLISRPNKKRIQALTQLSSLKEKDFDRRALKIISTQFKQNLDEIEKEKVTTIQDPNIQALLTDQVVTIHELSCKGELLKQEQMEKHFSMKAKYRAWNRGYMLSLIIGQFLI